MDEKSKIIDTTPWDVRDTAGAHRFILVVNIAIDL